MRWLPQGLELHRASFEGDKGVIYGDMLRLRVLGSEIGPGDLGFRG